MPWKKGQSGNPQGRRMEVARRLLAAGVEPSDNVYIPILDKRDPAKELIKLADAHTDKRYKMEIWMFLFAQKYKASKITAKPIQKPEDNAESDAEALKALEANTQLNAPKA